MNRKKQAQALQQIGKYFALKGKIYTQLEYVNAPDQPVPGFIIKRLFKTYDGMMTDFKKTSYWTELNKPAPKAVPKPAPKPAPKKAVKPAVKPAVKKEAIDE